MDHKKKFIVCLLALLFFIPAVQTIPSQAHKIVYVVEVGVQSRVWCEELGRWVRLCCKPGETFEDRFLEYDHLGKDIRFKFNCSITARLIRVALKPDLVTSKRIPSVDTPESWEEGIKIVLAPYNEKWWQGYASPSLIPFKPEPEKRVRILWYEVLAYNELPYYLRYVEGSGKMHISDSLKKRIPEIHAMYPDWDFKINGCSVYYDEVSNVIIWHGFAKGKSRIDPVSPINFLVSFVRDLRNLPLGQKLYLLNFSFEAYPVDEFKLVRVPAAQHPSWRPPKTNTFSLIEGVYYAIRENDTTRRHFQILGRVWERPGVGAAVQLRVKKPSYNLTVNVVGNGEVEVDPPGNIFHEGHVVKLKAKPASLFDHWEGDVEGTSPEVELVMDSNKTVVAYFRESTQGMGGSLSGLNREERDQPEREEKLYHLSVDIAGNGEVIINPPGDTFPKGTVVELEAKPRSMFDHWEGDIGGKENPIQVIMDSDKHVVAVFRPTKVELVKPNLGYLQVFDMPVLRIGSKTIILGRFHVEVNATDDVDHVSFYTDGTLSFVDKDRPFAWLCDLPFGKRVIKVIAYDSRDNQVWEKSFNVFVINIKRN